MEQKFKDFLAKYNGTFVEAVDASNLNQCFDLVIQFCVEVLGLPLSVFSGLMYAYQIWNPSTAVAGNNFEYILNTPDAVPQAGDIIVWSKKFNGTAGHTGIATGNFSDINKFQCFEQNDPTGSKTVLKTYSFNYVLGWLRFKGSLSSDADALQACLEQHQILVDKNIEKDNEIRQLKKQLTEKDGVISKLTTDLTNTNESLAKALETVKNLEEEVAKKEKLRAKWYEALKQCEDSLDTCKKDRSTFQKQLTECQNKQDLSVSELLFKLFEKIRGVKK